MNEQDLKNLGREYVTDIFNDRFCRSFAHYGIKGQRHGHRRFQNEDGSYTEEGRERYGIGDGDGPLTSEKAESEPEKKAAEQEKYEKENNYEPGTVAVADKLEKSGIDFNKYKGADGEPYGREGLEVVVDQALHNLKSEGTDDDWSSDEANMDSLITLYDITEEDATAVIKAAKEERDYHRTTVTTDKNGNEVVRLPQATKDQQKKGTPVKAVPVETDKKSDKASESSAKQYDEDTENAAKLLKEPGSVNWNKYMDTQWFTDNGVEGLVDKIMPDEKKDDHSEDQMDKIDRLVKRLTSENGLEEDDARSVVDTAVYANTYLNPTNNKNRTKRVVINEPDNPPAEKTGKRLLITNRTGRR